MTQGDPAAVLTAVARLVAEAPGLREVVGRLAVTLRESIPFERLHVLVIQAIGKNISGSGLDPNVAGRFVRSNGPGYTDRPEVQHIAVLDLTPETHGNAAGIGLADLISLRVLQKLDLPATYANCMTASHLAGLMLPAILENDRTCIATAIKTATRWTPETLRLAEGYVEVNRLGPIPVKGLPEPVEAYELTGDKEHELAQFVGQRIEITGARLLDPARRYLINPGSIGQPRDENPDAVCVVYDSDAKKISITRVSMAADSSQSGRS